MPQPTASDVHANQPLTNISIVYMQEARHFAAGQVFPIVPVMKQSDRYYEYDRSYWYRNEMKKRASGEESAGAGWVIDNTPTYFCDKWGLHKDIDDDTRDNADSMVNMDRDATEFLSLQAMINLEIEWASSYFTSGIWTGSSTGTDITPGTLWDASGGLPISDLDVEKEAILEKTGYEANVLVLGRRTFRGIKNNADVIDRVKYTSKGIITADMLAGLFEVEKVVIAGGVQNTAAEGATPAYSFIIGANDALLCYAEPRPSLMKPTAGYIFAWKGKAGAGLQGQRIKRFRMDEIESDRVEIDQYFDAKQVAPVLGAFFLNAVT